MSKKNSSVNLKNGFKDYKDLSAIFLNFKNRLDSLKKKKYLVAVSGGPDSLALVALTKAYTFYKKTKFYYLLVDHNIRKNSNQEAEKVKKLIRGDLLEQGQFENDMVKELGDVLWYVANLATELGVTLSDVAELNLTKLLDRQKRDVLNGSGDDR